MSHVIYLRDYFKELEFYLNKLESMVLAVSEHMHGAILLVRVMHDDSLKLKVAAQKSLEED